MLYQSPTLSVNDPDDFHFVGHGRSSYIIYDKLDYMVEEPYRILTDKERQALITPPPSALIMSLLKNAKIV